MPSRKHTKTKSKRESKAKPMNLPPNPILLMLADNNIPWQHRAAMLRELLQNINAENEPLIKGIFDTYSSQSSESLHAEKIRKLDALLKEIQEGPLRLATFIEPCSLNGGGVSQALVSLDDGTFLYAVVTDENLARTLSLGERVVLDGKGRVLLQRTGCGLKNGGEARLYRKLDERRIEAAARCDD